jgi:dTMP kinase
MPAQRGKYIVFEGGDAVGKSTTMQLVADRIRKEFGVKVYTLEEPGGVRDENGTSLQPFVEDLRVLIKDKSIERGADMNIALFNQARRMNWFEIMRPALEDGIWILGTRNWWSTVVYQGAGEGADSEVIRRRVLSATDPQYIQPDLGFILDIDEETRAKRLALRDNNASLDTFESKPSDFQLRVGEGYRTFAKENNIPILSTLQPPKQVADEALSHIVEAFSEPTK